MSLIKTKSFELAVNVRGSRDSGITVLVLPGRLDTKDYACFDSHLEYLADKGFLAVSVDPPGTWESPGGIELFTTTNYIKAVHEMIEYFGNKPTILFGHSRGGQVSMLAGAENENVVGIILINATYGTPTPPDADNIKDTFLVEYRDMPPGDKKTEEQKKFLMPLNYFVDGQKYNPIPAMKLCDKPKLIFYGTDDEFTSVEEVERIYASLLEPKMIHKLNVDHDYRYQTGAVEEINRVVGDFLDRYYQD